MPRSVENNPYAVRPVHSRPGTGAKEAATAGRPFADLLAEADSVRDSVRLTAPAGAAGLKHSITAGSLAAAAAGLWQGLGGTGGSTGRRSRPAGKAAPKSGPEGGEG
jgi:hypothetical protein